MTKDQIISQYMSFLSKRRTKSQRKGGRPKETQRCPCGRYTRGYAARRRHRCEGGEYPRIDAEAYQA